MPLPQMMKNVLELFLTHAVFGISGDIMGNVKNVISVHFSNAEVKTGRNVWWEHCSNDSIGAVPYKRGSTSRSVTLLPRWPNLMPYNLAYIAILARKLPNPSQVSVEAPQVKKGQKKSLIHYHYFRSPVYSNGGFGMKMSWTIMGTPRRNHGFHVPSQSTRRETCRQYTKSHAWYRGARCSSRNSVGSLTLILRCENIESIFVQHGLLNDVGSSDRDHRPCFPSSFSFQAPSSRPANLRSMTLFRIDQVLTQTNKWQ